MKALSDIKKIAVLGAGTMGPGIAQMFAEVGHMGTVKAMAEKFSMDPDAVLRWEWAKVYGILLADLREYEYEQRYARQMNHGRG